MPTKEGLTVELDVACLFHVTPDKVRDVFLTLGEKYSTTIVEPELASAVRGLTSEAEASALYTSGRAEMQAKLLSELQKVLSPRGITVESVLLKAVVLPDLLKSSIEQKVSAEQDSERMQFVIAKERQEAQRKTIEAQVRLRARLDGRCVRPHLHPPCGDRLLLRTGHRRLSENRLGRRDDGTAPMEGHRGDQGDLYLAEHESRLCGQQPELVARSDGWCGGRIRDAEGAGLRCARRLGFGLSS